MATPDRQALIALLLKHEGFRSTPYRDSRGFLTVGIGFNLDAPGAAAACAACGLDYGAIRAGQALTEAQAALLLGEGIETAVAAAGAVFGAFDALPGNAQMVILDMLFNMGEEKFLGFRRMIAAIEAGNWPAAAAEMTDSAWYGQVGQRAKDDVALIMAIRGASPV